MTKQDTLPPLPEPDFEAYSEAGRDWPPPSWKTCSMHDYARAARAAQVLQPEPCRNTKTHDHLSTMIGMLQGIHARHNIWAECSVMDKAVKEAVAHLKDWPYPEAQAPQQAQGVAAFKRVNEWAATNHIRFVSRSHGMESTTTISFDALAMLAAAPQAAPAPAPQALPISPLDEQQMFDDWCPYKGNPDPRVVWAAAIDAANGLLSGLTESKAPAPQALTPLTDELLLAAQSAITCSYADHGRRSVNLQAWDRLIQAVAVVTHGIGAASAGGEG
jgi:hypothetical protein